MGRSTAYQKLPRADLRRCLIQPLCNAFLIRVFLPLPIWVSPSNIAIVMKNLPPVTTNEKFGISSITANKELNKTQET